MNQGGVVVAQVVITGLLVLAFLLSLGAGWSALKKWGRYRARQRDYEALRARGDEFMAKQREAMMPFLHSHDSTEYDAFFERQTDEAKAAGFAPKSAGDFDLDNFVGEPPRETYQAPGEVWVGIVALFLATAASILDVWLT